MSVTWETPQSLPLTDIIDLLNGSAEWLRGMVEHPLTDISSAAGAGGPLVSIGAGITANFAMAQVTAPIENAVRICEIAGIAIGAVTGAHPLVIACMKRLAHDELGNVLARAFKGLLASTGTDREKSTGRITPRTDAIYTEDLPAWPTLGAVAIVRIVMSGRAVRALPVPPPPMSRRAARALPVPPPPMSRRAARALPVPPPPMSRRAARALPVPPPPMSRRAARALPVPPPPMSRRAARALPVPPPPMSRRAARALPVPPPPMSRRAARALLMPIRARAAVQGVASDRCCTVCRVLFVPKPTRDAACQHSYLSDLLFIVRGRPPTSARVVRRCYSVSYSPQIRV